MRRREGALPIAAGSSGPLIIAVYDVSLEDREGRARRDDEAHGPVAFSGYRPRREGTAACGLML